MGYSFVWCIGLPKQAKLVLITIKIILFAQFHNVQKTNLLWSEQNKTYSYLESSITVGSIVLRQIWTLKVNNYKKKFKFNIKTHKMFLNTFKNLICLVRFTNLKPKNQ